MRIILDSNKLKIAVLDLYDNEENQGMRCIKDILNETAQTYNKSVAVEFEVFDVRHKEEIPGTEFDIYISSGGPGSPYDGLGKNWETKYFKLMDGIVSNNANNAKDKKHVFFICHSFQIMARYFEIGDVVKRNSKSFGIMPVHKTEAGKHDMLLSGLPNKFYGADFRDFQVIQPNKKKLKELGAEILCIEKERPHVAYERAVMAVRISNEIVGTQFHPEADPLSMDYHFRKPERKEQVVSKYGEAKYQEMLRLLEDPLSIKLTRKTVLPNFLKHAVVTLRPEAQLA